MLRTWVRLVTNLRVYHQASAVLVEQVVFLRLVQRLSPIQRAQQIEVLTLW